MNRPDIFRNVHKGIRRALFEVCVTLGRSEGDAERTTAARAQLREVLRFVAHHGENEDILLLPMLASPVPQVCEQMRSAHRRIDERIEALMLSLDTASAPALYSRTCEFVADYLEHMREEETELEPLIRAALSLEQLTSFGRGSVERTAAEDQRMMLGWMLPAMTRDDVEAFLAKVPPALAAELRPMADRRP